MEGRTMVDLSQLGDMIRWPFLLFGNLINFIISNLVLIIIVVGLTYALWKFRDYVILAFIKLIDSIFKSNNYKEVSNGIQEKDGRRN